MIPASPIKPPAEALSRIMFFCNRVAKPFLLGHLASDIGWSLECTESYLEHLVIEGVVRHATLDEISEMHGTSHSIAYCVVKANTRLAHRE